MSKKQNDKKTQKRGFSIYWLFGKIGDILFIPIILISLFSSASMLIQKKQNKPTSFFGVSLVNVLSGSMIDEGFLKGDTVITSSASIDSVELGDVIAFYNYRDPKDSSTTKNLVEQFKYIEGERYVNYEVRLLGISIDSIEKVERSGLKTVEDAQKAKASIYFHRVIGIYVDDYGNVFYKTKGSNNTYSDDYIRSDFVVGEYVNTPRFLRDTMSFCASMQGMIILVCIPLSMLVLMQCFSLIKQIETMNTEKQLILGKKRYDNEEVQKNFNGNEMETYNKVFLYYLTAPAEREQVKNFMWSELLEKEKPSKKEQKELSTLMAANQKLEESNKQYWETWIEGTKGHTCKKLKKYYEEIAVYNVLAGKKVDESQSNQQEKTVNDSTKTTAKADAKTIETIAMVTAKNKNMDTTPQTVKSGLAKTQAAAKTTVAKKTAVKSQQLKTAESKPVAPKTTDGKQSVTVETKMTAPAIKKVPAKAEAVAKAVEKPKTKAAATKTVEETAVKTPKARPAAAAKPETAKTVVKKVPESKPVAPKTTAVKKTPAKVVATKPVTNEKTAAVKKVEPKTTETKKVATNKVQAKPSAKRKTTKSE